MKLLLPLCLFLVPFLPVRAAGPDLRSVPEALIFTAGTTHRDAAGIDRAYLFWQSAASDLLSGRAYAIYSKSGAAEAPTPYAQEGVVQSSLDEKLAATQLARAEALGQDSQGLDELLSGLWCSAHLPAAEALAALHEAGEPLPEPPPLPASRPLRAVTVLQKIFTDPASLAHARTMAAGEPALALVLGCAWAGPMPAGVRTYELREWDPQTCLDGAVVGRVTLTAGSPVTLPAPGAPVQVPDASENGDLRINLRWSTPDELRRRLFLHQGYEVWRMPWSVAEASGFHTTAPTLTQLRALATRVSRGPLHVVKTFSAADVGNFTADPATRHFSDDNNRFADPAAPTPFTDGAEFGYVVTARDALGRPGLPSRAGRGQACRTLSPRAPAGVSAALTFGPPDASGIRPQAFTVSFSQNVDPPPALPGTTHYEVFRTDGSFFHPTGHPLAGQIDLSRRIQTLAHLPGVTAQSFQDVAPLQDPASFRGRTWQYAVRAVFEGACSVLHSPLSPPAMVALEDLSALAAPEVAGPPPGECPLLGVIAQVPGVVAGESMPEAGFHQRLLLTRRDGGVSAARFAMIVSEAGGPRRVELGEFAFGDDADDVVHTDVNLTSDVARERTVTFVVRAVGFDGTLSDEVAIPRPFTPGATSSTTLNSIPFLAAMVATSGLRSDDPVAAPFIDSAAPFVSFSSVRVDAGTQQVEAVPATDPGPHCLVSRRQPDGSWREIAVGLHVGVGVYFDDPTLVRPEAGEPPPPAPAAADYRARRLRNLPGCAEGVHLAVSGDGRPAPVSLAMLSHPEAREYRFLRRVDDGELQLLAQGGMSPGRSFALVRRQDPGVPPGADTVTYYGQFMGKNGLASPLRVLGVVRPRHIPPTPVLGVPQAAGDAASPVVRLTWACPPELVERFEVFMDTTRGTRKYSLAHPAAMSYLTPVNYEPPPATPPRVWRIRSISTAPQSIVRREGLLTARIGSPVPGAGPQFSLDLPVTPNTRYAISLRAVGRRGQGPASRSFDFVWRPPPPPLADKPLPWPFRELPAVVDESAAIAAGLRAEHLPLHGEEPALRWPTTRTGPHVGFRLGGMVSPSGSKAVIEESFAADQRLEALRFVPAGELPSRDFNAYLGRIPGTNRLTLPAVLYRQQLPSEDWPVVSGDVVQVSPLVSRVAWEQQDGPSYSRLRDPDVAVTTDSEEGSTYFTTASLYLLDTSPRVAGARYRYWLVCFGADTGAPELVIPSSLEPRDN